MMTSLWCIEKFTSEESEGVTEECEGADEEVEDGDEKEDADADDAHRARMSAFRSLFPRHVIGR